MGRLGRCTRTVDSGRYTMNSNPYTVDSGHTQGFGAIHKGSGPYTRIRGHTQGFDPYTVESGQHTRIQAGAAEIRQARWGGTTRDNTLGFKQGLQKSHRRVGGDETGQYTMIQAGAIEIRQGMEQYREGRAGGGWELSPCDGQHRKRAPARCGAPSIIRIKMKKP